MIAAVLNERLEKSAVVKLLFDRAKSILPVDAGHDFSHIERVMKLTLQIFHEELKRKENRAPSDVELDSCILAALLHDCVPIAKNSPLRKESSRLASEKAGEWLNELQFATEKDRSLIVGAIHDHSFSSGRVPTSLLGESLQDADRLEALGALGLYRTIATGVSMGTELFDPLDPWAKNRELDDKRFSLDHFYTKLLKLPETFRTKSAKEEANQRAGFLRLFAEQLAREIN